MAQSTDEIEAVDYGYRGSPADNTGFQKGAEYGEILTMRSGQVWFHPASGGAPRRMTAEENPTRGTL